MRTDELDAYGRLDEWGYRHETVRHARGEDGDVSCEVHVDTAEGLRRSPPDLARPHRGISRERPPAYLGFSEVVHNARRRRKALLGTLVAALLASAEDHAPRNPTRATLL